MTLSVSDLPDGLLRIYFTEHAPSEPSLQYFVNEAAIRRLDVNGDHRKWAKTTHKHTYDPSSGREDAYIPSDIPEVSLGSTVAQGTYRGIFEAFAAECFVQLPQNYWVDPPGGGR